MSDASARAERHLAQARALVEPHLDALWEQRAGIRQRGRRPAWIGVPRDFPETFDGATLLGMPVCRTDVTAPTMFDDTQEMPS